MSTSKLTKDEKEILKAFESGKFKQVKDTEKAKAKYQQSVKYILSKPRTISIRISKKRSSSDKGIGSGKRAAISDVY